MYIDEYNFCKKTKKTTRSKKLLGQLFLQKQTISFSQAYEKCSITQNSLNRMKTHLVMCKHVKWTWNSHWQPLSISYVMTECLLRKQIESYMSDIQRTATDKKLQDWIQSAKLNTKYIFKRFWNSHAFICSCSV